MGDQMMAAIEHDDWPTFGRLAVDGFLHTCEMQHPDGAAIDYEEMVAAISHMQQHNLVLLAAEALRRLYESRRLA